jgi:hypothetical protein
MHHQYPDPAFERKSILFHFVGLTRLAPMPDYTEHATNSVAAYIQNKHVDRLLLCHAGPRLAPLKSLVTAFFRNKCTFLGLVSLTVKR